MNERIKTLKDQVLNLGYTIVVETEKGVSLVNEAVSTCVIVVDEFDEELLYSDSELREPLEDKYPFATKGTICIFATPNVGFSPEDIESSMYYALRVWAPRIDCIPHRKEDITINIKPIENVDVYKKLIAGEWEGSTSGVKCFVVNPFREFDGTSAQDFYRFLNGANDGDLVMYPAAIGGMQVSWFRYIAGKFYNVNFEK
jgi:hypothetical protein